MIRRVVAAGLVVGFSSSGVAQANANTDSLIQHAAIDRAETVLYGAVRARPRDPEARWRLGNYLVARGATRVGVTLIEEAVRFGFDQHVAARALAPLYLDLGEYQSLAALTGFNIGDAARARARWLIDHPTRVVAPDSVLVVSYQPSSDSTDIGQVAIRLNGRVALARVSVTAHGVVLSDSMATLSKVRRFVSGPDDDVTAVTAVLDSLGVGRLTVFNLPMTVSTGSRSGTVVIGLDALARFAPTFDPRVGHITLRTGAVSADATTLSRYPIFLARNDISVAAGNGWISLASPQIARMLREHPWTLDARHGQLVIEP